MDKETTNTYGDFKVGDEVFVFGYWNCNPEYIGIIVKISDHFAEVESVVKGAFGIKYKRNELLSREKLEKLTPLSP